LQDLLQQELPEEPPKPEKVSSHINYGREIHFLRQGIIIILAVLN
jgi:hypothetical protein